MHEVFWDKKMGANMVLVEVAYSYIQDKYDGNVIQYIDDKWDYMESMEYKDGWLIYDSSIDQLYYLRLMYSA